MPASLSVIAAKDGAGATIAGGLQALDLSGAGTGPWSLANILVDGVSGSNRAGVTSNNAIKMEGVGSAGTATGGVMTIQGVASMTAVAVSQSGNWTARAVGNAGGIFDFAGQNAAAPANAILMGGEFNTTPTTISSGNASPLQLDNAGNLLVNVKAGGGSGGTALADRAAFTYGTTSFTPIGGVYNSSITNLTAGQAGAVALTIDRNMCAAITAGGNTATVKAASTGNAVATDVALVCTLRDMNPNGANTANNSAPVTLPSDAGATTVAVSPTVTAGAYTTGKEVGGLMTFSSAGRTPNTSGIVQDVTLTSKTVQSGEFDLYLFDSNPSNSTWTDNTTPAINAADVNKLRGVVKLTKNYSGLGTHTIYKPDETTFAPTVFAGATLYGVLVTIGTPTFGSTSDLTVTLGII